MMRPDDPQGSRLEQALADALADLEASLGRPPTESEAIDLAEKLRKRNIDTIIEAADGRPDWRADARHDLDGASFGLNVSATLPTIWGAGEKAYWSEGELAIAYGGDGTNKTTLTHNVLAGMLGFDGFETVLGQPVRRLRDGEQVLYMALDRPRQIERSWSRFMRAEHADEAGRRLIWRTDALPFDPVRHPLWVAEWVAEAYPSAYAIVLDNVWDAFGDFSDTEAATSAGIALNALARSGTNVLALHHDRKGDGSSKTPPETHEGMYGGRNFAAKAGSIVNLWKPPGSEGLLLVVTQHKEPSEKIRPLTTFVLPGSGRAVGIGTGDVTLVDFLKAQPSQWLEIRELTKVHRGTESPTPADKEATRRELERLEEAGTVEKRKAEKKGQADAWRYSS